MTYTILLTGGHRIENVLEFDGKSPFIGLGEALADTLPEVNTITYRGADGIPRTGWVNSHQVVGILPEQYNPLHDRIREAMTLGSERPMFA